MLYTDAVRIPGNGRASCAVPASLEPRDVKVELSLNAQQFTVSPQIRDSIEGLDGLQFNYYNSAVPPTTVSGAPESGSKGGGTPIRVRGSNFANVETLKCRFIRPPETCSAASGSASDEVKAAH